MTTNEQRIKEIAEKHCRNFLKDIGLDSLSDEATDICHAIEQAITEATKDLSATIEAQKKEIEELMRDKERLDFYCLHRHLVASRISIIEANCGRGFNENFLNIRVAIDSAISKQEE